MAALPDMLKAADGTPAGMQKQFGEIATVLQATREMSGAIQEVARSATQAASSSQQASTAAEAAAKTLVAARAVEGVAKELNHLTHGFTV